MLQYYKYSYHGFVVTVGVTDEREAETAFLDVYAKVHGNRKATLVNWSEVQREDLGRRRGKVK